MRMMKSASDETLKNISNIDSKIVENTVFIQNSDSKVNKTEKQNKCIHSHITEIFKLSLKSKQLKIIQSLIYDWTDLILIIRTDFDKSIIF